MARNIPAFFFPWYINFLHRKEMNFRKNVIHKPFETFSVKEIPAVRKDAANIELY